MGLVGKSHHFWRGTPTIYVYTGVDKYGANITWRFGFPANGPAQLSVFLMVSVGLVVVSKFSPVNKTTFSGGSWFPAVHFHSNPCPFLSLSCPKRIDILTFWFSDFDPFLVMAPKGDHLLFLGPLGN